MSRATSGRLPSNDETLLGTNAALATVRSYGSSRRLRHGSFAENALERYGGPQRASPTFFLSNTFF